MADNVAITSGSGTPISTDEIAGVHYQRVKLTDGTADSTTPILSGGGVESGALRVTIASDSTGVVSVDDNGGALTVDGTVTANLSATDNQVLDDISAKLPAALAANGGLKIEGVAGGVAVPVSIASVPSHAVTNAGTFATQVDGAALTALQLIDDPVATLGTTTYTEAATKGMIVGAVRRDANTTLADTTNEVAPLQVNATGELKVAQIQALPAGTNNIGDVDVLSIAAGDNNIGNVDIVSVPAPLSTAGNGTAATAHRVTIASDSTGQVALAAGSAAIGKLVANSGVDIGDVDVLSVIPGTGATNLGKVEDAAHSGGDVGVMALAVRSDANVSLVGSNGDYSPLTVDAFGHLNVNPWPIGTIDSFGNVVTGSVNNQIDIQFYRDTPANLVTVTTASGGSAAATGGMATFACTTATGSNVKGVTGTTTIYTAGAEIYAIFTAAFTGSGSGTSYQRIGLYDANNGVFVGFEANTFGVTRRTGASDTDRTSKANFNLDTLTGAATSGFTRAGAPEAIDLTKLNVWRVRMGWVGSAPINFEVLSPDGNWVTFHTIRQPNSAQVPSMANADLPFTCDVFGGNSGAALSILTNCWCAGTTQRMAKVNAAITANTLAELGRSVIVGESTAGGGSFVNVKVNPSGSLSTVLGANSGVDIGDVDVTSVIPGTGATNLGKAISSAVGATDTGVMLLAVRDDTLNVRSDAENDYEPLHTTSAGRLYTSATVDAALPAGDNNIGNIDIVTVPAPLSTTGNGTAATALRVTVASDSTGQVVLAAGSAAIGKLAANSGVDIGDVDVLSVIPGTGATNLGKAEDAAHSSGDTGVQVLAVRKDTAAALAGADGDYAPLEVDANGRLHVLNLPLERTITIVTGTAASSGDNSLVAAPGVGVKIVVCGFVIQNESSTATTLILRDGTTSKIRCYAKNQGDGLSQVFTPDARWKLTANTALNLNLSGANTCGYTVWYYTE